MKFCIKDLFSKCDQIRSYLRIWSHLLKKSLMQNFLFCAVKTAEKVLIKLKVRFFIDIPCLKHLEHHFDHYGNFHVFKILNYVMSILLSSRQLYVQS